MELDQGVELQGVEPDVQAALVELFGTPDDPKWPEFLRDDERYAELVDLERLRRAAGPVRSDENDVHFGLFREHCVHCHGVTGNGLGPTSEFLNPYPRDFRPAVFKFKSTKIGVKPTRVDLKRILQEGVMGTSMPSFRLLKSEDVETLVDYVIYLGVRGEVERELINEAAFELDYEMGDRLFDPSLQQSDAEAFDEQWDIIQSYVFDVADQWVQAAAEAPQIAGPPEGYPLLGRDNDGDAEAKEALLQSVARGREIYRGKIANCASCHGPTGMGDGQVTDFDSWTKEWTTTVSIDPNDEEAIEPMLELGALKPRNILPRNLRSGIYRGGSRPIDIYLRIVNGIEGSPMPATAMQPSNPQGLTEAEAWDLVNFVLSLPYEHLEDAVANEPSSQQESP
ncbi:MAG: cytochrome c [Aureliella sp.]